MSQPILLPRPVRALAALAALLVVAGCEANTTPAPKSERPVQIQRVSFQDADRAREFVGVVRPRYETDLGFRVAGKIVTRIVNVGDRVAVGDVVARLDPEDLRLQLQSADAELAAATFAIGQPVARLAHHGEKEAVVALPETWLNEARKSKALVRLWADRERSFEARLRELSPQADAATRTYAARFTIENADEAVAYGMTATVTLTPAVDAKVAKLPLSAILNRGTGPSVYVVDTSRTLTLRPVTVASFAEDAALVTHGIADGEEVVALGVQKLEPGLKVRTLK